MMFNRMKNKMKVGDVIPVGEFFWTKDAIGFAENAAHRDGLRDGVSADIGCTVRLLKRHGERWAVVLHRTEFPRRALAPIGAIFFVHTDQIESWRGKLEVSRDAMDTKNEYRHSLGKIMA